MGIGTRSCKTGENGSPCMLPPGSYCVPLSLNFVSTLNPSLRQEIAFLALGGKARQDTIFYSSLHETEPRQAMPTPQISLEAVGIWFGRGH